MNDSLTVDVDQPCLIRRGPFAGATGVILGHDGECVVIRLDEIHGVVLLVPPRTLDKPE